MPGALRLDSVIALLLQKQHLTPESRGSDVLPVAEDLLGLHATDRVGPYLQLLARVSEFAPADLERELDAGRAARLACMRRTLFIESAGLLPLVVAATRELNVRDHERFLAAAGLTRRRYETLAARIEAALEGRALDARALREAVGAVEPLPAVLVVMCDELRLLRWKGQRGWRSAPPRYRRFAEALPDIHLSDWDEQAAVRELVHRYVCRYGPVSEDDVAWWTGLRKRDVRAALASWPDLTEALVDGLPGSFLVHDSDLAACRRRAPKATGQVALLPLLDPYLQGYRDRTRFADQAQLPYVVDGGGNATSTIVVDGRVAGVWDLVAKPAPELRLFFLAAPGRATRRRVHDVAAALAAFLAGVEAPVREVDAMTPLPERKAGAVMSPLSDQP